MREWEAAGDETAPQDEPITIDEAWNQFRDDAEARGLRLSTLAKYRLLCRRMEAYAERCGLRSLCQFDLAKCRAFRSTWSLGSLAARKMLERLRGFSRFAHEAQWVASNPAKHVKTLRSPIRPPCR